MAVGGPGSDTDNDESEKRERKPSDVEPVFFHGLSESLCEDIINLVEGDSIGGILDFTPGDGSMAITACRIFHALIVEMCLLG